MMPFDPSAKCPKCGYANVETCYHDGGHVHCNPNNPQHPCWGHGGKEHLSRICRRCAFGWIEATSDVGQEK